MLHSTQCIVLQNIKYADNKVISKIYTKEFGLINLHQIIGTSKKTKQNATLFLPLTQLDVTFKYKENKDIHQLIETKCNFLYQNIHSDIYKLCIVQFINEVMIKCLKDQSKNENLFYFLTNLFKWIDETSENYTSIHVYFLFEFTKYLGFYPLNNFSALTPYFNTTDGKFTSASQNYPFGFDKNQSKLLSELFKQTIGEQVIFNKQDKKNILEGLLQYYKLHVANFNELKSYQVLIDTLA